MAIVWLSIAGGVALGAMCVAAALAAPHWRRIVFGPFAVRAEKMTVARLGLRVRRASDIERVDAILGAFAGGFNAMLTGRHRDAWRSYCAALPTLYQPFAHEGAAMGYIPRGFFRYDPVAFEADVVRRDSAFRYLYYVGLGFWAGMRKYSPARVVRMAEGLDPLHRYLVFDGYGFKHAFFDHQRWDKARRRIDALPGYARNAAYQGVGRALFFRFMADADTMIGEMRKLGDHASDAAAGAGLAAVFVNPDRLDVSRALAGRMPEDWRAHFHLGMCFGLKARSINELDAFERHMASLAPQVRDAVWASIRECDRVELLVRSEIPEGDEPRDGYDATDRTGDGYRQWRERVTAWMHEHIEYPLAGVRVPARRADEPKWRQTDSVRGPGAASAMSTQAIRGNEA